MDYGKYKNALEKAKVRYNEIKGTNCSEEKFLLELFPELKENKDRIRQGLIKALSSIGKRNWGGIDVFESIAWLEKQKVTDKEIVFRPLAGTDIIAAANQALEKIEIGKEVILAFNGAYIPVNGKTVAEICNEYFSWLEKQGEKKVPYVDFNAKDWYVSKVDGKIHDITYNPTDKLEPKFKFGDWIVNNNSKDVFLIKSINSGYCTLESIKGNIISPCLPPCESESHIWTIQDAKDGDVLIDKSHVGECVFIFKEARPSDIKTDVNNPLAIIGYCGINHIGFTSQLSGLGFGDTVNCTYYPATKEQRDLLFKKIEEAGYQWDAEKKELKKIEQKPVNDTVETIVEAVSNTSILDMIEDKDVFTNSGAFENSLGHLLKLFEKLPKQDLLDGLKFYTNVVEHDGKYVKPTEWNNEDERMRQETIDWFEKKCFPYALEHENPARESIKWLKSLKERVQPKQEWSEEDEKMVEEILDAIEAAEYEMALNMSDVRQWLKNLKQRLS